MLTKDARRFFQLRTNLRKALLTVWVEIVSSIKLQVFDFSNQAICLILADWADWQLKFLEGQSLRSQFSSLNS